jgi:hypothetical protein
LPTSTVTLACNYDLCEYQCLLLSHVDCMLPSLSPTPLSFSHTPSTTAEPQCWRVVVSTVPSSRPAAEKAPEVGPVQAASMARPPRDNDRLGTSSWKPFFLQEPKVLGLGWGLGWWVRVNERKLLSVGPHSKLLTIGTA